jgi:DNA-binding protein HU-beta
MERYNMKKNEIIASLVESTGVIKADVEKVYNATFELIKDELSKGNEISVAGFGKFKISERAARTGRNPQTGETIQIAASKNVSFKTGKELKEKVNA